MRQLFYYKMRQKFHTKYARFFITKCDSFITNVAVITTCNDFYSYYKMRQLLQNAKLIINYDTTTDIKSKYGVESFFRVC